MRLLPLLLLLLPIAELLVLIEVGSEIGGLAVLGLLAAGVILGLAVLRGQGLARLLQARRGFEPGTQPEQQLVESVLLAMGGLLLLIPGFITDALSLPFLLPWTRRALARRMLRQGGFEAFGMGPSGGFTVFRSTTHRKTRQWQRGETVEGEVLREPEPAERQLQNQGLDRGDDRQGAAPKDPREP